MANGRGKSGSSDRFYFGGFQNHYDGDCSHEIKRHLLLGRKARQPIIKHHFADKGLYRQSYGFSSSHVQMWELGHKEGWVPKNWCFWTVALENLRVPWTAMRLYQSNLKEIKPEYSLEGLMLKFQYLGHLMQRADSLEKTLMLRKTEAKRRREWQR